MTSARTPSSISSMGAHTVRRTGSPKMRISRTVIRRPSPGGPRRGAPRVPSPPSASREEVREDDRPARGDLRLVRHAHDAAGPRREVRLELTQPHERRPGRGLVEHHDGVARLLRVPVGLQPREGLGRQPRLVDAESGDDDDLVGEVQGRRHHRVDDPRAGVGEDEGVVVRGHIGHVAIVVVAEGLGDTRVGVRGEHVEARRIPCHDRGDVVEPAHVVPDADEVAHGLAMLRALHPVGERSAVGVGVHGDDAVLPRVSEGHAEERGDRGLAHAALPREHRHEPGTAGERGGDPRRELLALARATAVADVQPASGQRV